MEFTVSTIIKAKAFDIFEGWLNSEIHTKMTGGEAVINNENHSKFSNWDGYIQGENVEIKPNFIKQSWRTTEFDEDQQDSIIEIHFDEIASSETKIILHHSHLLEKDLHYKKGWEDHYFEPMKLYFESSKL